MSNKRGSGRVQLALSLILNAATRVPGVLGLVIILPLMKTSLGNTDYAILLGSIALGSVFTFLFGGFNTIARREIGIAHARNDFVEEARAIKAIVFVNGLIAVFFSVVVFLYQNAAGLGLASSVIPIFVLGGAFLNTFDNIRAAYNEHYVTATLQIVLQTSLICAAIFLPSTRQNIYLDAVYLTGHTAAASAFTGLFLIRKRPYTLSGDLSRVPRLVSNGIILSLSDGLLMACINLSVVFVTRSAQPATGAWYATLVRLFQTILTPILLIILPVSSFVRLKWDDWSKQAQSKAVIIAALGGALYGVLAAILLVLLNRFYIGEVMQLQSARFGSLTTPLYAFAAVLIAYKAYSTIAFAVLEVKSLTLTIMVLTIVAILLARALIIHFEPIKVVAGTAGVLAAFIAIGVTINIHKQFRPQK